MADITGMLQAAAGASGEEETDANFNQTVLLLHGDGTNGAQNNTFVDSSTNNFTITRNGNTTQGTFSPFSAPDGRWSNYFDGTSDNLSVANNAAFQFGTGDFTVEAWVYQTVQRAEVQIIAKCAVDNTWATGWALSLSGNSSTVAFWINGSAVSTSSPSAVTLNGWSHVAVSRSGTTLKLFINGVEVDSDTNSTSIVPTAALTIGADITSSNYEFQGYISNVRVVKGTALYTGAFTPPTTPLTAISGTSLLTCQSNRFVDNSTNNFAITRNGDVKVTPFSPFAPTAAYDASVNGGSGYFDGSGDYLSIADAAGLRFGTGNFTIQCWIYRNAAGAVHSIAAKGGASTGWVFQVHSDNKLRFTHTTTNIDSTGTIPASAWTHVAVVREGTGTNQVKLYINGVNDGQGTVSTDFNQTEQLNIGADRGNSNVMNGYIAGWKYVVGTAETITVPTAPPTGGTALLNFTNAGIFDNTGKNNLETVGNAQIDTTTKKYGTGSMEFDGTGDTLLIPPSINNLFITASNFTLEFWYKFASAPGSNQYAYSVRYNGDNYLYIYATSSGWVFDSYTTGTQGPKITSSSLTHDTTTFHHFALVYDSGTYKMFVDGTSVGSQANSSVLTAFNGFAISLPYYISGRANIDSYFNGFIDDFRITKGVARYTTTFTPPTKAFPDL